MKTKGYSWLIFEWFTDFFFKSSYLSLYIYIQKFVSRAKRGTSIHSKRFLRPSYILDTGPMLRRHIKVYLCSLLKIATEKEIISIDKITCTHIYRISHFQKLKRQATSERIKVKDLSRKRMKKGQIRQYRRQVVEWGRERELVTWGERGVDVQEFKSWHFSLSTVYSFLTSVIKSSYTITGIKIVINLKEKLFFGLKLWLLGPKWGWKQRGYKAAFNVTSKVVSLVRNPTKEAYNLESNSKEVRQIQSYPADIDT